jgi:hypothetical protein
MSATFANVEEGPKGPKGRQSIRDIAALFSETRCSRGSGGAREGRGRQAAKDMINKRLGEFIAKGGEGGRGGLMVK